MGYKELTLEHMRKHGYIDSMTAFQKHGNTRLSATIFNLRKQGYRIDNEECITVNRHGTKVHYVKYRLIERAKDGSIQDKQDK